MAASAAVGAAAGMLAERGIERATELVRRSAETFKQYDLLVRNQRAIAGITEAQQKPLIDQAIGLGGSTPFNDIQVLEAQRDLIKRGIKVDLVEPIIKFASGFGQAMDVDLPTAAKTLETAIFSTAQNMETAADAMKNAQRTTDIMVKTAKISGMSADEEAQFYKFGGAAAHAAGMSIETMSALGAMMRRGGIPGDEAGVAIRSISGSLISPTQKGMMALSALGIDYNKYTTMPGGLSGENLSGAIRRDFGKKLSPAQINALNSINEQTYIDDSGKESPVVTSREEYTQRAFDSIKGAFGHLSAKDAKEVAKEIGSFYKMSVQGVDVEGLLRAIIAANPNAAQANAFFTKQQGGRFQTAAQRGIAEFDNFRSQIDHVEPGFADFIGAQNMAGFAGAVARYDGATKNLETAIGRANESWVTPLINTAAEIKQGFVESGDKSIALATQLGI
ncbi:MAG TPA: phage tail tape measure protein, partial [Methylocystis sp.]